MFNGEHTVLSATVQDTFANSLMLLCNTFMKVNLSLKRILGDISDYMTLW